MNKLRLTDTVYAFIAGLLLSANTHAQTINVDFGPLDSAIYAGQGILGGPAGTFWNAVDSAGATNLAFADGTGGTSGVSLTFGTEFSNLGDSFNPGTNTLLADRVVSLPSQTETITISGLAANSLFDIVLYNAYYAQEYSITGQPGVGIATTTPDTNSPNADFPNWTEGVEYARLSSAMSDGSGQLQIQDVPIAGGLFGVNSALAGMQIQAVPLPASIWLFGSGLMGFLGMLGRKKT